MPHYDIRLRIVCGETTCAVVAGRFCGFCITTQSPRCALFGRLTEANGWIERHPECLTLATPAEKPKGSA